LAQLCALQFWKKSQEDRPTAWQDYLTLCQAGGSQSFLNLVKLAKLNNPFDENTIKPVVESVKNWLSTIDDKKL
jgi:oligoendopeptidase F